MSRLLQEDNAVEIRVTGTVQGVGFRPHVYKLATSLGLRGWVINTTAGVTIRLEGTNETIERFEQKLRNSPPPLAQIDGFQVREAGPEGFSSFSIYESKHAPDVEISIPPDVGTCPECLREFSDTGDRRYGYAFTNCVNCGPRFSITRKAPYDREHTSMNVFEMCEECSGEYTDPSNRRFHAEPNACPACGPQVILTTPKGEVLDGDMETVRSLLKNGKLLAIKGIGGYHLACDARNVSSVRLLRECKRRHGKPFALMCRDLETVRMYCELSAEEEKLLTSPARPIVLLKRKAQSGLSGDIAPGLDTLGIMLPYMPLHYGLFDDGLVILVMTSANISGDPLIITEEDAYKELGELADIFAVHKREIVNRADDSVVMVFNEKPYFVRRSRGYVPQSIALPFAISPIFAAGGDLKSVFAFARDKKAIPGQFFGDLDNLKNLDAYRDGVRFFGEFLRLNPERMICDLHPDYVSTRYAEQYAEELGVPLEKVQHHKAHFASTMVDSGLNEEVLGVVCDGTGYGDDGNIWGFEFFYGDYSGVERVGSLMSFSQPRGDNVVKYPEHMAAVLLYLLWQDEEKVTRVLPGSKEMLPFVKAQASSNTLSIPSSSCGRLFDVAAALCGFTGRVTYEGEAPMRMESLANRVSEAQPYNYDILEDDLTLLSWHFIEEMAGDKLKGTDPSVMAACFHHTIAAAITDIIKKLASRYEVDKVVFSGGTFQNRFVVNELAAKLTTVGISPYFHSRVPTNDGGIALGQIALAHS